LDNDDGLTKHTQISNFMKIRPVDDELFHSEGQPSKGRRRDGRHDEANNHFSQICECV